MRVWHAVIAVMVLIIYSHRAWCAELYAGDPGSDTTIQGFKMSGPFIMHGDNMIACKHEDAAQLLAEPDAATGLGWNGHGATFLKAGCQNIPDGVIVDVKAAGPDIALVFPRTRSGDTSAWFTRTAWIFSRTGQPIGVFHPAPYRPSAAVARTPQSDLERALAETPR